MLTIIYNKNKTSNSKYTFPLTFECMKQKRRCMGDWCFVRYLRNAGISFPTAYYIMFQRQPSHI